MNNHNRININGLLCDYLKIDLSKDNTQVVGKANDLRYPKSKIITQQTD